MVVFASCLNTVLLLLAAAFVAIQGYHQVSSDGDTGLSGFRYDGEVIGLNQPSKRETGKNVMWIGPRLGRRKRSEEDAGSGSANVPDKNGEAVMEFLQDTPWAFVALKGKHPLQLKGNFPLWIRQNGHQTKGFVFAGSKRRTVNFIPRLGRDSEEEFADGGLEGSFGKSRGGSQIIRPFGGGNNFTPRLGRFAGFINRDRL